MVKNFYWTLPQKVKDFFRPKGKTQLTITAFKEGEDWMFNLPPITWKESLCFPEALNEIAKGRTKVKLFISTQPVEGAEVMHWERQDPCWTEANEFSWNNHIIWLCPWLQWWFGEVPQRIWFTVQN